MEKSKKNVPKIRFRGYSEEWKEECLSDSADIVGGGTPSTNIKEYWDGDIDWYSPAEIGDKIFVGKSQRRITELGLKKSSAKILPVGTVLFSSRAGIGSTAILIKEGTTNQGFQSIIPHVNKLNTYFIFSRTSELKHYGEINGAGSTFIEISGKQMACMPILNPEYDEQIAIGNYFQNIDKLIETRQIKLDKLKNIKKASLEKMFPKKGATVPEIRFKGFTGDWVEKELGELMNVTSVKRIHQSDWTTQGIRFLRARDIVSAYKNEIQTDRLYISKEKYIEYSAISGKVQKGDLLVTGVGTIGVPFLIKNNNPIYFKDGNIIWFKNNNKIYDRFLFYSFTAKRIQDYIKESAGIGTVGTYTIESGKKTPILLPSYFEEQERIGSFLKNLHKLITKNQQQLTKLKNIKKACLQKMFVNKEDIL